MFVLYDDDDALTYFGGAKVDMEGLTGRMKFYEGRRTEFELDILQLSDGGLSKVRRNVTSTSNKVSD